MLVAAVGRSEDMTAGDINHRVAFHAACRTQPHDGVGGIGLVAPHEVPVARAAAEDLTIEGVAIAAGGSAAMGFIAGHLSLILIIGKVYRLCAACLAIGPGTALDKFIIIVDRGGERIEESLIRITLVSVGARSGRANLATLNLHMGVATDVAVLATAKDGAFHQGRAADGDISLVDIVEGGDKCIAGIALADDGVTQEAFAGTEDVTHIFGTAGSGHRHRGFTHLAGADHYSGLTGVIGVEVGGMLAVVAGEVAYGG